MIKQAAAIIIPANPAEPIRRETISTDLETCKGIVGGWLEGLPSNMEDGWVAYGNEESKIFGLPVNVRAHQALVALGGHNPQDLLRGNVFFIGMDDEGEMIDSPADLLEKILAVPGVSAE